MRRLRFSARRADWLHGRFTTKQLFCLQNDGYSLSQVEIDKEPGGAPFYRVDGLPLPCQFVYQPPLRKRLFVQCVCHPVEVSAPTWNMLSHVRKLFEGLFDRR